MAVSAFEGGKVVVLHFVTTNQRGLALSQSQAERISNNLGEANCGWERVPTDKCPIVRAFFSSPTAAPILRPARTSRSRPGPHSGIPSMPAMPARLSMALDPHRGGRVGGRNKDTDQGRALLRFAPAPPHQDRAAHSLPSQTSLDHP